MGAIVRIKRKTYTQWDETDNLKRMKDSDILAEKKRPTSNIGATATATAAGVAGVGTAGLALGAAKGLVKPSAGMGRLASAGKTAMKYGKTGAIAGGLIAGTMAIAKGNKQAEENKFYNKRLEYAQRQARRREKADWKNNMTGRDGYSY